VGASLFAVAHSRLVAPGPGRIAATVRGILFGDASGGNGSAAADGLSELVERPYLLMAVAGDAEEGALRLVLGRGRHRFDEDDLELAQQTVRLALPSFRNACLIERLTAKVAEMERLRLGRDIHDSAIQPYIGLKFAIEALARKVQPADPLAADIDRLLDMMQDELGTMRSVIKELRHGDVEARPLVQAIRSQVRRLAELYDLQVDIDADDSLSVGNALVKELPHMVSEALSNIRRHTHSRRARVSLSRQGDSLVLAIHNQAPDGGQPATAFEPKSLSSRAAALGGYTSIHADGGGTTVTICLPMH
jgi:signal transduction histidine kinase